MKDLGSLNYFFGISAQRSASGLFLSQSKFAEKILERAHMQNCNPCRTPVDTKSKLGSDGDPVSDATLYRSLAGALQYLTFTRPDLSYAVQHVCLYMHDPRDPHFTDLKRIIRYVRVGPHPGIVCFLERIFYHGLRNVKLPCCSSARSMISRWYWANVVAEPVGSCCLYVCNPVPTSALRPNIEIDIHFVRDFVASGQVRVLYVPSRFQYADIFTKGLPIALFIEFRSSLNVRRSPAHTEGE
ncbi:ribonuclease H-like domain-containing protein [Tanacetum coccineum]